MMKKRVAYSVDKKIKMKKNPTKIGLPISG